MALSAAQIRGCINRGRLGAMTYTLQRSLLLRALSVGSAILAIPALPIVAQSIHVAHVTVTDSRGRFVTGMGQENFDIIGNGAHQRITGFSDVDSPISLAIVSEKQLPVGISDHNDVLIQTGSVAEALRQLSVSKNARRALIATTGADVPEAPADIQVVRAKPDDLPQAIIELRNEFLLQFESDNASQGVEVVLKPPRGLLQLQLQANLK